MSGIVTPALSGRDRALLRAIAAHRCKLTVQCEPLLLVDGVGCADSAVARRLIDAGLLAPAVRGAAPRPAELTAQGRAALDLVRPDRTARRVDR